ncbi:MAG: sensor histidine kinase, partial [Cytophagaceae bacterium]
MHLDLFVNTVQELSMARDIETIMQIVRTTARELTGADGATFILREDNQCYYADEDAISPLWKGSRFPMKNCISGWAMINKKPAIIEDIFADERIPAEAYRPTFVKSLAMVPIRTMDPIGAIGNYWAKTHHPTTEEVELLQALADITAVSIENVYIYNELDNKLKERTKMLKHLSEQNQQLEDYCQIISHNLRAPLSNLALLADIIKESNSTEEKLLVLEKLSPITDFLYKTFEELVESTQVRMDYSISKDQVDLNAVTNTIIETLQGEIINSNANIQCDFTEMPVINYPKKYAESLLFNLISNAIKYHSPKRIPQINIRSFEEDNWVCLEIKDNGLG